MDKEPGNWLIKMNKRLTICYTKALCGLFFLLSGCTGSTDNNSSNSDPLASAVSITPISGMAPLNINATIQEEYISAFNSAVRSIQWDFGDGSSSSSTSASHRYSTQGSYTLTVTATSIDGDTFSYSDVIHVAPQINNSTALANSPIFFDNFEYAVSRENDPTNHTDAYNAITNIGGWHHVKAENTQGSGKGYLSTVTEIPGYQGTFPGRNSSSVLLMEARPITLGFETDFYLQYGSGSVDDEVPADVWFQFWMYPAHFDEQLSQFENRFKFIYPCNGGYGCTSNNIKWLNTLGHTTGNPFWANRTIRDTTELYVTTLDPFPNDTSSDFQYAGGPTYDAHKTGHTNISENITHNRWTLVQLHYDTSSSAAGGTFEAWLKPLGGSWVKVAEWINGQTVEGELFTWNIPSGQEGGHRLFRMPTTVNDYDFWIYMDDFAIASSRADLPSYNY